MTLQLLLPLTNHWDNKFSPDNGGYPKKEEKREDPPRIIDLSYMGVLYNLDTFIEVN